MPGISMKTPTHETWILCRSFPTSNRAFNAVEFSFIIHYREGSRSEQVLISDAHTCRDNKGTILVLLIFGGASRRSAGIPRGSVGKRLRLWGCFTMECVCFPYYSCQYWQDWGCFVCTGRWWWSEVRWCKFWIRWEYL